MEGFLIRGGVLVLPGWRRLYELRISVSTLWEAVSTRGGHRFRPRFAAVLDKWKKM